MTEHNDKPDCRERASSNIAHMLSGELSPADEQAIGGWNRASPEYQQEFLATAHLLADMEPLQESDAIQAILHEEDDNIGAPVSRKRPGLAVAAGLLIATVAGIWAISGQWPQSDAEEELQRYITRVGEQREVQLTDGSVINLNTGSELLVNMRNDARIVTLKRGEAFFSVASDPARPFSVDIGPRTVTVLGTEFNVHKVPEGFIVAVVEGEVALHNPAEQVNPAVTVPAGARETGQGQHLSIPQSRQYRLTAGWVARYDAEQTELVAYTDQNLNALVSWRTGLVTFAEQPLSQVIKELNRYSGKKILIVDKSVMDLKVNAGVRIDSIGSALSSLERVYPIRVKHDFDQILIESVR